MSEYLEDDKEIRWELIQEYIYHSDVDEIGECNCSAPYAMTHLLTAEKRYTQFQAEFDKYRWIAAEERLPKKTDSYLVVQIFADHRRKNGFFNVWRIVSYDVKNGWSGNNGDTITHWMIMPELPELKGG